MTSASSLAFPGSRTLATWWRQLAPFEPQTLGVGYLFVHRVQASASWLKQKPVNPLLLLVLRAFALEQKNGPAAKEAISGGLHQRLQLEAPLLHRLLRALAALQLIAGDGGPSGHGSSWKLTDLGREALGTGHICSRECKRAMFPFVERLDPAGHRRAAPHFLRISDAPSSVWIAPESAGFDPARLRACVDESWEWKHSVGFPSELAAFPEPDARPGTPVAWDHVVLDRTERLLAVLFDGPKPAEEFFGFGVRPEGWLLQSAEPIIRLPAGARAAIVDLNQPESLDAWKNAWQEWCQTRGVSAADANECAVSLGGERLHIAAPARLVQYLHAAKSDVFKGESWLFAGEGYVRQAARLEIEAMA